MLATRGPAPSAPRGERGITPPRPATSCADAPIIGSTWLTTSSNVAICSDIVCVECARLSLTSQFSFCVSKLSTHSTHKVARREQEPTVLPPGGRGRGRAGGAGGHNEGRGNPRMSHLSTHARECTARLRELSSKLVPVAWSFFSAPARYSSNKRRSTLSRAASAGRTCERSKQATRSRSRGEPGCWRTSSSSACSEGGAAGQRA